MFRLFFIGLLWALFMPALFAKGTLSVNSGSDLLEEGRTYTFHFTYIQTEGTDVTKDISSLSFNSIYSADVALPLNGSATFSFRDGNAKLAMSRVSEDEITINGKSYPLSLGSHHYDIIVREANMYLWIDADTTQTPFLTVDSLYRCEGKADFPTTGGTTIKNSHLHVDYAYGLRFSFIVPNGTKIPDVKKTNDQLSVISYAKMTLPPMLYNSTPNDDGSVLYCDLHPTDMCYPIPYGTIYTFQWEQTIKSCDDSLTNQIVIELYNHDSQSISFSKTFPCGENTCPLDTAYILADSYCKGDNTVLKAVTNLPSANLTYEWNKYQLQYSYTDVDTFLVSDDANYQVKVSLKDDESCSFTSQVFSLERAEKPEITLCDSFVTDKPLTLCPVSKAVADKYTYKWSTGATTASIVAKKAGSYKVQVANGDCVVDASTSIRIPVLIDFPKVLSPNGDGVNDVFSSNYLQKTYPDATIKIFNRYGKQLAAFHASDEGWNGSYNGTELPSEDYWYEAYIPLLDKYYTGHFSLLRQ